MSLVMERGIDSLVHTTLYQQSQCGSSLEGTATVVVRLALRGLAAGIRRYLLRWPHRWTIQCQGRILGKAHSTLTVTYSSMCCVSRVGGRRALKQLTTGDGSTIAVEKARRRQLYTVERFYCGSYHHRQALWSQCKPTNVQIHHKDTVQYLAASSVASCLFHDGTKDEVRVAICCGVE